MKLVLVEWVDAHSRRGWHRLEDLADAEPLHCRSVGWLVGRKGGMTVLAASISGEKNGDIVLHGSGDITIPNRCITKTTVLRK